MSKKPETPDHHDEHWAAPHAATFSHTQIRSIVLGIALALFLSALEQTIVATALAGIGRHFNNVEDLAWVVTAYLLAGTATTPLLGKLSDIHGRRIVLLCAVSVFIIGSIACALAPDMTSLVLARALQGLGGGALVALGQTIIADIVSPRERGRYQGYIGAVFALASIGGPVLGGFLTERFHWSLIFWINVPLGIIALTMVWQSLKGLPFKKRNHKLDAAGALLMMSASVSLLLALSWGGSRYDWFSLQIGGLIALSASLWALFGWRLTVAAEPFLPLNVLRNKIARFSALGGACSMATLIGLTIFSPLYFETLHHMTATQSGVALIPMVISVTIAATTTGRALGFVKHYKIIPLSGFVIGIMVLSVLAAWPDKLPLPAVLALQTLLGASFGLVFPVSTVCMQNAVSGSQMGIATGMANFFRALLASLMVAILGAIVLGGLGGATGMSIEMLARSASVPELAYAFRLVFIACALMLCIGLYCFIRVEEKPLRGAGTPPAEV